MSDTAVQRRFSSEDLVSEENLFNLDGAMAEVFGMMLGCEVKPDTKADDFVRLGETARDEKTAIVGFAGALRGTCEIRMNSSAALAVASAMIGAAPAIDEIETSMCDAVGELCNMVAGGWKNRVPSLESLCSLSPPTVISGSQYQVHSGPSVVAIFRDYAFEGHRLKLTILMETSAAGIPT